MNKIYRFFSKLYQICLIIGAVGIAMIIGGILFCNPLYKIGFGCIVIGMMACISKQILSTMGDK